MGDAKRGVPDQAGVQGPRKPLVGCRGICPAGGMGGGEGVRRVGAPPPLDAAEF